MFFGRQPTILDAVRQNIDHDELSELVCAATALLEPLALGRYYRTAIGNTPITLPVASLSLKLSGSVPG
jgi:hypothetical protein